jgi:hypothetical protein
MSFKNDLKNAQIMVSNHENKNSKRLTNEERRLLLKKQTPWSDFKIDRLIEEGWK